MKITVLRTGGIRGVNESLGPIDTESLSPDQARSIEEQVEAAGFFELPSVLNEPTVRDGFTYRVTVVDGERQHTATAYDGSHDAQVDSLAALTRLLEETGAEFEDTPRN